MVAPSSLPTITSSRGSHSFQELTGQAAVSRSGWTWANSLIAWPRSLRSRQQSGIETEGQGSSDCERRCSLVGAARYHAQRWLRSVGRGSVPAARRGAIRCLVPRALAGRGRRPLGLMPERPQEVAGGGGGGDTSDRAIGRTPVPAARVDFSVEDRRWIAERIEEILASGQLTLGRYGAEFEQEFARHCRLAYGVAVASGTA